MAYTCEATPTIIEHPGGADLPAHKDCHPVARMPDGKTLLASMSISPVGNSAI